MRSGTYRGQCSTCEKQMTFRRDGTPHGTHKRPDGRDVCPGSIGGRESLDAGEWLRARGWASEDGASWALVGNDRVARIATYAAVRLQINIEARSLLERMGITL